MTAEQEQDTHAADTASGPEGEQAPQVVHLTDTDNPEVDEKPVTVDITIGGIGESYGIPKEYTLECINYDANHAQYCPLRGKKKEFSLPKSNHLLLACYGISDAEILSVCRLRGLLPNSTYELCDVMICAGCLPP